MDYRPATAQEAIEKRRNVWQQKSHVISRGYRHKSGSFLRFPRRRGAMRSPIPCRCRRSVIDSRLCAERSIVSSSPSRPATHRYLHESFRIVSCRRRSPGQFGQPRNVEFPLPRHTKLHIGGEHAQEMIAHDHSQEPISRCNRNLIDVLTLQEP